MLVLGLESAAGVEVGGFDETLAFTSSVTVVVLVTVTWSGELEFGDFDGADKDVDGVARSGALLAGLLDAAEGGADERVSGPEGEVDTSTLVTEVLNGAGGEEDAGLLLIEILEIGVEPGVVEAGGLDETADVGEEGLPAVETTTAVVVVGAAEAGVASTSPQARAAMELLR